MLRNACAFLSEKQCVAGLKMEFIGRLTGFRREQHQPFRARVGYKGIESGMAHDIDVIDVIHGGTPDAPVVPFESHRLDQMYRCPETGAEPEDGADISGNFRFEQGNAHRGRLARPGAIRKCRIAREMEVVDMAC